MVGFQFYKTKLINSIFKRKEVRYGRKFKRRYDRNSKKKIM